MTTVSKFALSVAAPKVKGDVSTTPELMATVTKDKIRLNSAFTRKLLLETGDHLMFITNEDALLQALAAGDITEEDVANEFLIAVAKSVPKVNSKGEIVTEIKRLNNAEKAAVEAKTYQGDVDEEGKPTATAFHGFKLAANGNEEGIGRILEGSDATQWPKLKGTADAHQVWVLGEEVETVVGNTTVKAFVLEFDREEAKVQRKERTSKTAVDTEGADVDANEPAVID